jgi:uncharacterized protein YuzE
MKIEFDPVTDALYVKLSDSKVIESEEVQPGVVLDFDDSGKVVGVEILSVSQQENHPLKRAA